MEDLYPYTDVIAQEKLGVTENFKSWDFAKHPTDYLVLNIGTNDATFVMLSEEPEKTEQLFEEKYRNFLKLPASVKRIGNKDRLCAGKY